MKIIHLTSVHDRYDNRILFKQCISIMKAGRDVSLIVADGRGDEIKDGVKIYDVGTSNGRLSRMVNTTQRVYKKAIENNADVYHLHDPELIPWGIILCNLKKKVIYDMHENLPKQIRDKSWIPVLIRNVISKMIAMLERIALKKFYVIFAELSYIKEYRWLENYEVVLNLPIYEELINLPGLSKNIFTVGYIGGVSRNRGILIAVESILQLRRKGYEIELLCVGNVSEEVESDSVFKKGILEGWVQSTGRLSPQEGLSLIAGCHLGIAVLRPIGNYVESYPTKMFEYMSMGIPVLASNFSLYSQIIDKYECGLCVNPEDIEAIKRALVFFYDNSDKAKEMGYRGQRAVQEKYNWEIEAKKLLAFYDQLV